MEKGNRNTYNISSIKRVTGKFLEVSRRIRSKQRQRNVQKKRAKLFFANLTKNVLHVQRLFWLIRASTFFWLFSFIFCLENYKF